MLVGMAQILARLSRPYGIGRPDRRFGSVIPDEEFEVGRVYAGGQFAVGGRAVEFEAGGVKRKA